MKGTKKELYGLLYEWFVREWNCDDCQHFHTFRDGDRRHPCNKCEGYDKFKVADNIVYDLKEKVRMIMEITKKK